MAYRHLIMLHAHSYLYLCTELAEFIFDQARAKSGYQKWLNIWLTGIETGYPVHPYY